MAPSTQSSMDANRLGALWFGFTEPVDRRAYALSGFSLMAFKYATDALFVWSLTGALWRPSDYLSPLVATRQHLVGASHSEVLWVLFGWALPFVWVGASMTVRRAL